jgi:ligand-binding sensor protein
VQRGEHGGSGKVGVVEDIHGKKVSKAWNFTEFEEYCDCLGV